MEVGGSAGSLEERDHDVADEVAAFRVVVRGDECGVIGINGDHATGGEVDHGSGIGQLGDARFFGGELVPVQDGSPPVVDPGDGGFFHIGEGLLIAGAWLVARWDRQRHVVLVCVVVNGVLSWFGRGGRKENAQQENDYCCRACPADDQPTITHRTSVEGERISCKLRFWTAVVDRAGLWRVAAGDCVCVG